jgi:hypothetical protein
MTTEVVTAEGAAARHQGQKVPYGPSWLDLVVRAIDAAPGPTWLAYVVIGLFFLLLVNTEGWLIGIPLGGIDPAQSVYAAFFLLPLLLYHYLSRVAGESWDRFRPATNLGDEAAAAVRYGLTVTPARGALVASVLAVAMNVGWLAADPYGFQLDGKPMGYVLVRVVTESVLAAMVFVLLYQVLRQLVSISRLHTRATHVEPLRPAPMHAFARLTSRAALGIIAFAVLTGLPLPGIPESTWLTTIAVWTLPTMILGVAIFVLPLRGMNKRLVDEKARWLNEIGVCIETTTSALHSLIDRESANEHDPDASRVAQTRIDALSKAQAALIQERELLGRQSTWPWDPSTLRAVVSAIALPIVLFLITRVLDRFV